MKHSIHYDDMSLRDFSEVVCKIYSFEFDFHRVTPNVMSKYFFYNIELKYFFFFKGI